MKLETLLKAMARKFRIPYETVLKDYAIGHLLSAIAAESGLASTLVMKGGTALKKLYFGTTTEGRLGGQTARGSRISIDGLCHGSSPVGSYLVSPRDHGQEADRVLQVAPSKLVTTARWIDYRTARGILYWRRLRWIIRSMASSLPSRVSFEFEPEKLVATIAMFAGAGLPELTTLKIAKLLYFADKRHLLRYGRPITGDAYVGMKNGPVPSIAYDVLKGATGKGKSWAWTDIRPLFENFIEVVVPPTGYAVFRAKRKPDTEVCSKSDLAVLREVITELGQKTASDLWTLAHGEKDYASIEPILKKQTKNSVPMPYETFFEGGTEDVQAVKSLVLAEQEDRDFFARLDRC
jgi:hypothetical protein